MPYLFVGEKRSQQARDAGWTWESGHLAAAPLLDALEACGFSLVEREFTFANAYLDDGQESPCGKAQAVQAWLQGWIIIGMGQKAQAALAAWGIPHRPMIHPAARGKIRKQAVYRAHVREVMGGNHAALYGAVFVSPRG